MIRIFRGDDVAFSKFDRRVCVYIQTFDDLTGWTASFELYDNVKSFSDISSGAFSFGYSAEETQKFPLGLTYAKLTLMDATGKTRVCKKVEVEVQNRIAIQDCGSIAISTDVVFADYSKMGNLPTLNGKKIEGNHDSAYYGLASAEQMDANANLIAITTRSVAEVREQMVRTTAAIADQGTAIATNAQNIQGNRNEIRTLSADFRAFTDANSGKIPALERKIEQEKSDRIEGDEAAKTYARELALSAEQKALDAKRTAEDLGGSLRTQISSVARDVATEASQRREDVQSIRDTVATAKEVMANGITANEQKIDGIESTITASVSRLSDKVTSLRTDMNDKMSLEAAVRAEDDLRIKKDVDALRLKTEAELDTAKSILNDRISNIETKSDEIDRRMGTSLAAEIKSREFTDAALTAESGTRLSGDRDLANRISAEKNLREAGDADTLAAAKAYTDQKTTAAIVYRGSVNTVLDLDNIADKAVGDMYNVKESGANYVWSGGAGADYHGWDKQSETINLSPLVEKDAEQDARLSAVEAKAEANESAISEEVSARTAAISAEREYADTLNAATVETFSHSLASVQSDYASVTRSLSEEVTARTNGDATLDAKIDAEQTARGADVTRIDSAVASLRADLTAEIANRTSGDSSISTNIGNAITEARTAALDAVAVERTARENADRTLAADIANETELRERAITLERTARENAISAGLDAMNTAVAGEATARADADANLGNRITTEITNRQTAVTDEANLRKQNDDIIYAKIETEREQSVARDTAITQNLAHETDVRTSEDSRIETESRARDTALQNAISQEALDRASSDADMLQAAKDYADSVGVKAMHYKGTKSTFDALPSSDNVTGDIWNVADTGANYAWNGSGWDKLSETVDLSPLEAADAALSARINTAQGLAEQNERDIGVQENVINAQSTRITNAEGRISITESEISGLASRASALEQTVNGTAQSTTDGLVRRLGAAENAIADANSSIAVNAGAIQTAISRVSTLEGVVGDSTNGLVHDVANLKGEVETATTGLLDRTRTLEGVVGNATTGLVRDVQTLQAEVETANTGIAARLNALDTQINDATNGIARRVTDLEQNAATLAQTCATKEELQQSVDDAALREQGILQEAKTYAEEYADGVATRAMHYRGSVADRAALEAIDSPNNGDIYNVGTYTDDDNVTVHGANFAWNENASAWDKLSETVDVAALEAADSALADRATALEASAESVATRTATLEETVNGTEGSTTDGLVRRLAAAETAITDEATARSEGDTQTLADAKAYTDSVVAGAVNYKGVVADSTELNAIQSPTDGDMYFVEDEAKCYAYSTDNGWQSLNGFIDLTPYALATDLATAQARVTSLEGVVGLDPTATDDLCTRMTAAETADTALDNRATALEATVGSDATATDTLCNRVAALEAKCAQMETMLTTIFGGINVAQPQTITLYRADGNRVTLSVILEPNEETGEDESMLQINEVVEPEPEPDPNEPGDGEPSGEEPEEQNP